MNERAIPRYPIYIPSRGRSTAALTARTLLKDNVAFRICVAPFEEDAYREHYGDMVLPLSNNNMDIVAVRNWIRDHAEESGSEKHWQLDDNIRNFYRRYKGRRMYCNGGVALRVCEDFSDRYENIALSGLNYYMFCPESGSYPPFVTNCKVYSCTLVNHASPYRWRGPYNDDTDLCLQVLAGGWCTVSLNAFLQGKISTMLMKGGMTDSNENSYKGDGRLKMARTLERRWPGVVETKRRFHRPQHVVKDSWRKFDTPLKLKDNLDLEKLAEQPTEYGLRLKKLQGIKSRRLKRLYQEYEADHHETASGRLDDASSS